MHTVGWVEAQLTLREGGAWFPPADCGEVPEQHPQEGAPCCRSLCRWWTMDPEERRARTQPPPGLLTLEHTFNGVYSLSLSTHSIVLECSLSLLFYPCPLFSFIPVTCPCPLYLSTPPHSFVLFQQTTQHNNCYIFKEYFGRGYSVAFFSVKCLLLINGNKKWRKLSDLFLNIFSWCSFPSCSLIRILHW